MAIEQSIIRQISGRIDDCQTMEIENILRLDQLAAENGDTTAFVASNRDFHRQFAFSDMRKGFRYCQQ